MAADESLEALAVSELDIEHPALALHQAEGIELALVALVIEDTEVAPVDFEALAGPRFHAHEGAGRRDLRPQPADVIAQDSDAAFITEGLDALQKDDGAGTGVPLEQLGEGEFEGVELAGSRTQGGCLGWGEQILLDCLGG